MRFLPRQTSCRVVLLAVVLAGVALASLTTYRYETEWLRQQRTAETERGAAGGSPTAEPFDLSVHDEPRPVPEIRFTDDEGHALTLADFRGRAVLLNVWATWCVPCRKEMPSLDRLEKQLGSKNFIVLPLSIDRNGATAVKPFYQELGLASLGIYLDPGGRAQSALAISGIPATLLIDREGREVARKMGPAEWDSPEMIGLIRRYLPSNAVETEGR
jgi:thiol-disulfide isomerase/thioredoxin